MIDIHYINGMKALDELEEDPIKRAFESIHFGVNYNYLSEPYLSQWRSTMDLVILLGKLGIVRKRHLEATFARQGW